MAQRDTPEHSGAAITFERIEPYQGGTLLLTSEAIDLDGWLDPIHARDGDDLSPALAWSAPPGVVSYALVVEDPDAPRDQPYVHWLMWNIPGSMHELPRGVPARAPEEGESLGGSVQGRNDVGTWGWTGMAPPAGHGPHRYYFQLFGLDRRLDLDPGTPLVELVNVLKGATVAKGLLVGTFVNEDSVMDRPSPARTGSYGEQPIDGRPTEAELDAGRGGLDRDDVDRHAPHRPSGEVR